MSTAAAASAVASGMASSPRFRTWPITAVKSLEPMLQKMGLKVSADAIDGTSKSEGIAGRHFSDALVSVGAAGRGGTGSFVSSSGLILTNWHVAYDAVRQASLQGSHDYVRDGFVAKSLKEELKGPNYEVWITKSCKDVSKEVTDVIGSEQDPLKRANRVRDVMQEIAQAAQEDKSSGEADGGKRCDVQEMLPNESYVLFTYERIKDVRIVYVPPKSLGNFGGDTDNFEWPRHTADFTLLRAYVGPDGMAAEYSVDNVPYKPKTFLKVQQQGATEGDFIFLLGFPGSTMRYAPTSRLRFSDEVAVPNMVSDFARKLQLIAQYEKDSEEAALKLGTSKKGLANEYKRSQGKLVMMRKLGLMQERSQEEAALCAKAPEAKEALDRLSKIYDELRAMESVSTALEACRGIYCGSALLAVGHALHEYLSIECPKPDSERESSYRQRNLPFLAQRLAKRLGEIHQPHEAALVKDALATLEKTPDLKAAFAEIVASFGGESYLSKMESAIESTELKALSDPEMMKSIFAEDGAAKDRKGNLLQDPFVKCAGSLWEAYAGNRDRSKALLSERDALFAKLLELQRKHSDGEVMYPDCNGSLRLSAGFVEGYEAADAVLCKPQTTLAGLFDKAVEAKLSKDEGRLAEFGCPDRLYDMLSSPSSNCKKVPVCILYSTDTVGGNSGSPVMNASGELVGINFDRQRQGLMNEFKWSKDYSRSMGVDVRYMLWLMGDYDGAKNLVQEMLTG